MAKLIILSASSKIKTDTASPIHALQRFDGALMKQMKKYYTSLSNIDVMILSQVYGLVAADDKIAYKKPLQGPWNKIVLDESELEQLRKSSLSTLRSSLSKKDYDEIYINLGKELLKIIQGFESMLPSATKVTYAQGKGMGPKMAHMRDWIKPHLKSR